MTTREIHQSADRASEVGGCGLYPGADPVQGGQKGSSERAQPGLETCETLGSARFRLVQAACLGGTLTSPNLSFPILGITEAGSCRST